MAQDFQTAVSQSAADKLIDSVQYPFTVIDRKTPYEQLARFSEEAGDEEATAEAGKEQISALLKEVGKIRSSGRSYSRTSSSLEEQDLALEMSGALNSIAANANECLAAQGAVERHNQQNPSDKLAWDGPTADELNTIIEAASEVQPSFERLSTALGDWGIKALVTWLKVATKRPRFKLSGRSFELGVDPIIDGTGEVWLKHPWLKCVKKKWGICYGWKKIVKHTRLLSVTLKGLKFKLDVRADVSTQGTLVQVRAHVQKFRLDHRYLDQIPLEKLVNSILSKKPITVFDASKLIATLPMLGSKFTVDKLSVPDVAGQIAVEVTIRQVR